MKKHAQIDIGEVRDFLIKRHKNRVEKRMKLLKQARQDFKKIIQMITHKYKPVRIYQWGSLLNENNFSEISDIDIAVEGINNPELFFKMYDDAARLTTFPLDLVQIEKINPIYADSIQKKGHIVYERN